MEIWSKYEEILCQTWIDSMMDFASMWTAKIKEGYICYMKASQSGFLSETIDLPRGRKNNTHRWAFLPSIQSRWNHARPEKCFRSSLNGCASSIATLKMLLQKPLLWYLWLRSWVTYDFSIVARRDVVVDAAGLALGPKKRSLDVAPWSRWMPLRWKRGRFATRVWPQITCSSTWYVQGARVWDIPGI